MTDLQLRFGRVVRQSRTRCGLSQEQLAEAAGLNRSYLGEIERGLVCPSLSTTAKLATALQLKLSTLLSHCEEV